MIARAVVGSLLRLELPTQKGFFRTLRYTSRPRNFRWNSEALPQRQLARSVGRHLNEFTVAMSAWCRTCPRVACRWVCVSGREGTSVTMLIASGVSLPNNCLLLHASEPVKPSDLRRRLCVSWNAVENQAGDSAETLASPPAATRSYADCGQYRIPSHKMGMSSALTTSHSAVVSTTARSSSITSWAGSSTCCLIERAVLSKPGQCACDLAKHRDTRQIRCVC